MALFKKSVKKIKKLAGLINENRLQQHVEFIKRYKKQVKDVKYKAINYKFPVITKQEIGILLYSIKKHRNMDNEFIVDYEKLEFEPKRKFVQSRLMT